MKNPNLCLYFALFILCCLKEIYEALSCSQHGLNVLAFEALLVICSYMVCSYKEVKCRESLELLLKVWKQMDLLLEMSNIY